MIKVLEVNVDDLHMGGVYSLVKNVIQNNKNKNVKIDIAAIEIFRNQVNIDYLKHFNCEVFYIGSEGSKWKKQIEVFNNLKRLILTNQYACIHIHADTANKLLVSGLASKSAGVKRIVLHSHSAGIDGNHRAFKKAIHMICRTILPQVGTTFVACSDYAAAWMFPSLNPQRITIIKNGIDLKKFKFNKYIRAGIREELGIEDDEILIGHVGRFLYQKNHEYLIEIIREATRRGVKAKLLLVGEGERYEEISELTKKNDQADKVIFYGSSNRVNDLMMAMDVFLLPSHFEGLPIVAVEAQATGLPVLLSDKITREAKLTENVIHLPIGEADVSKWVSNIDRVKKMDSAREHACEALKERKYDISDTVESFLRLYNIR